MSAGLPRGEPASTQRAIVAISSSLSDGSFLNDVMPIDLSMWNGGISRELVRVLIERAHGRASSYVMSDIGAISPARWQLTHERWRIGATSLVNVGCRPAAGVCALAIAGNSSAPAAAIASVFTREVC